MISAVLALLTSAGNYDVQWSAPKVLVEGRPYSIHVAIKATKDCTVPSWMVSPSAIQIDGKPVDDKKPKGDIPLVAGADLVLDFDLSSALRDSKSFTKKPTFKLSIEGSDAKPIEVRYFVPAPKGLDFLDEKKAPAESLAKHFVLLETNRGNMVAELWPDVAPKHVRNFLELAYTGFYDGTLFHRVQPGFMIQGGDPNTKDAKAVDTWGTGQGPRQLKAEFNAKKHARGVLSMARGEAPDSATCQFFVVHAPSPGLDGKYSGFGMLIDGFDVLDKIVTAQGQPIPAMPASTRPTEPQRIEHALVLVAP